MTTFFYVLIPELNMGQLVRYLKSEYCVTHLHSLRKVKGLPFKAIEIQKNDGDFCPFTLRLR